MQTLSELNSDAHPLTLKLTQWGMSTPSNNPPIPESKTITTLSQLTQIVESGGRLDAVRLEKNYHPDTKAFALIKKYHPGLSFETYEMMLQSSWGKFQIMGDNLYLLGLSDTLLEYCGSNLMQEIFYSKYCVSRNIAYTLDEVLKDSAKLEHYALRYNGSKKYANTLMAAYNKSKA